MAKHKLIICLLLFSLHAESQKKDTISVCVLLNMRPSAMAYAIPKKKCRQPDENLNETIRQINERFEIDGEAINATSCLMNKYTFIEVVFKNAICDTVAVMFAVDNQNKYLHSKPYKVNISENDFRISEKNDSIILYRRIKMKGRIITLSFEFNKKLGKFNTFRDNGLSIW